MAAPYGGSGRFPAPYGRQARPSDRQPALAKLAYGWPYLHSRYAPASYPLSIAEVSSPSGATKVCCWKFGPGDAGVQPVGCLSQPYWLPPLWQPVGLCFASRRACQGSPLRISAQQPALQGCLGSVYKDRQERRLAIARTLKNARPNNSSASLRSAALRLAGTPFRQ